MDIQGECDSFRAEVWVPDQCLKETIWFLRAGKRTIRTLVSRPRFYKLMCGAENFEVNIFVEEECSEGLDTR